MKVFLLISLALFSSVVSGKREVGQCGLQGFSRRVEIEGCEVVEIEINACRGCCESRSFPSDRDTVGKSGKKHNITARSSCCVMVKSEPVPFLIQCGSEEILKEIHSATVCACGPCSD